MKVVVALDSSAYAFQIVEEVARRAWPKNCEFLLLSVVEQSRDWEAQQQFLHQTEIILNQRADYLQSKLSQCVVRTEVAIGTAARLINEHARLLKANLIVLGSHGDTGPRRTSIGSVAAAVANDAPCSVELVKIQKEASLAS